MKNFEKKINLMANLRGQLDCHIWDIFSRYIKENGILFNGPEDWQYSDRGVYFYGTDGCMGCYDNMSLHIPMKFFTDPENSFNQRKLEREQKLADEEARKLAAKEKKEREEFERLSKKFGGDE